MKTGLRLEPIYDVINDSIVGYEVLCHSDIPNRLLFARPNPLLEHHVLHMMDQFMESHDYLKLMQYDDSIFFTMNISIEAIITYIKHIDRLPKHICFDLDGKSMLSLPKVEETISVHHERIYLDDYLTGNANLQYVKMMRPRGVKFDPSIFNSPVSVIKTLYRESAEICKHAIYKKIENLSMLDMIRDNDLGQYAQGYVFNNKNIYFSSTECIS